MVRQILLFIAIVCITYGVAAQTTQEQEPSQELGSAAATSNTDSDTSIEPESNINLGQSREVKENIPPSTLTPKSANYRTSALLQGLNKITAHTSALTVNLLEPIQFGNLTITLHSCWKSPPEEDTENKALIEIWEEIPGEQRSKVFSGWMFSSSPLISAPQHPVYDITFLECTGEVPTPDEKPDAIQQ